LMTDTYAGLVEILNRPDPVPDNVNIQDQQGELEDSEVGLGTPTVSETQNVKTRRAAETATEGVVTEDIPSPSPPPPARDSVETAVPIGVESIADPEIKEEDMLINSVKEINEDNVGDVLSEVMGEESWAREINEFAESDLMEAYINADSTSEQEAILLTIAIKYPRAAKLIAADINPCG